MMATLPHLRRILPSLSDEVDLATDEGQREVASWYDSPAKVRLNMVTTLTGGARGTDGTSDTITNRADRTILSLIRESADAVLVGAESVRRERYIAPKRTDLVVLSRSGNLGNHKLVPEKGRRIFVVTPEDSVDAVRDALEGRPIEVLSAGRTPRDILNVLQNVGIERVVCEGGPTVAGQFLDAGVIEELCITVSPAVTPTIEPFIAATKQPATRVVSHVVDDEGFSYLRLAAD